MSGGTIAAKRAQEILAAAPESQTVPGARARIRAYNEETGRRIAVLDDDPTGSQCVHDVAIVTVLDPAEYEAGLAEPGATCFVLTNSRSMGEAEASAVNRTVGQSLCELAERLDAPVELVSRGDSTLRGHVVAEVQALDAARREATGRPHDAVLFAPAFFEAGRVTAGDVQWARVGGELLPVGATEFARDVRFHYRSSDLRDFLAERSGGAIGQNDVLSISLDDVRLGGPERVAEVLDDARAGTFVVVNATDYADMEIVVLGVQRAQSAGRSFVYRTGPSFVRALAGLDPAPPLRTADLWPNGRPPGHGLLVVGSHVGLTTRQLELARGDLAEVELDVGAIADPSRRHAHVAQVATRVALALKSSDVVVYTSRTVVRGPDPDDGVSLPRAVSAALVEVVRAARAARPAWIIAKGGITSHDVAVRGLGIRRAHVLGQMQPGIISVFRPVEAAQEAVGVPYIVFPGNVGDETTLGFVLDVVRGGT